MKTVSKYTIKSGWNTVTAPAGADWIGAYWSSAGVTVIAIVETTESNDTYDLWVASTLERLPEGADHYVGTAALIGKPTQHVFSRVII